MKDYYALLGVPRNATTGQLRRAYREAAQRLHPDKNLSPGETELFLEVSQAYETLIDPTQRDQYDKELAVFEAEQAEKALFECRVLHSRNALLSLDEPQVHYVLIDIKPSNNLPDIRPPINLSIVIDRSTSMKGQRMDQVRSAVLTILEEMQPDDRASIVAFSDRAEVIVSADQARDFPTARARLSLMQAGGGTEIAQGLLAGLDELHRSYAREGINHLILLTDGRTYGDEDQCLELADQASAAGITINAVGIGGDWSDRLLDDLASRTGGSVLFLNSPRAITDLLHSIFDSLTRTIAKKIRIEGAFGQQVDLRSTYRLLPEPMPLGDSLPMQLGALPKNGQIRLLLELVIHPFTSQDEISLAYLTVSGVVLSQEDEVNSVPVNLLLPVVEEPDIKPPPDDITSALNLLSMYKLQEKARHEAELGQVAQAARRLENLATQLLAAGERELAKAALNEAAQLGNIRRFTSEGEKTLKYGTRSLLLLPPSGNES
jgi:Ca-activated chloride channel family protein